MLDSFQYGHINTLATTTLQSGVGHLHSIVVNTKGASASTATVYDSTTASGNVIAVIDTTANVGPILFDVGLHKGLTIVTATGTAPDLTVVYK